MLRIVFDLDETLGAPIIVGNAMVGWQMRTGCAELLTKLSTQGTLCLWSVSNQIYVNKALSFGLHKWFKESYSWDEIPDHWKDIRKIRGDFLIDDSPHHLDAARRFGIESHYILIPAYGSPEDSNDPMEWARIITRRLLK